MDFKRNNRTFNFFNILELKDAMNYIKHIPRQVVYLKKKKIVKIDMIGVSIALLKFPHACNMISLEQYLGNICNVSYSCICIQLIYILKILF